MAYQVRISNSKCTCSLRLIIVVAMSALLLQEPILAARVKPGPQRAQSGAGQSENELRTLEPGKPIERQLAGGEVHSYRIILTSLEFLQVVVEQRGANAIATLFSPHGKELIQIDMQTNGPQSLSWIAEEPGNYRLEIRSQKDALTGRYTITAQQPRPANAQDRDLVAAERAFATAAQLYGQGLAESLHRAINKYEEALLLWQKVGNKSKEAETLSGIGAVYKDLGEPRKALDYHTSALMIRRGLGDKHGEGDSLVSIGEVYDDLGERQKALANYHEALGFFRETSDRGAEGTTLHDMGLIHWYLGEYTKAIGYLEEALPLRRDAGDRAGEAQTLNAIGSVYNSLGDREKALEYFNRALPIRRAVGNPRGEAVTLSNLGITYDYLGEKQKALEHYYSGTGPSPRDRRQGR